LKKKRGIRLRELRELIKRLQALQGRKQKLTRDERLLAVGQAREQAGRVVGLVEIHWPDDPAADARTFTFQLRRAQYKIWRRREGRYLLRTSRRLELAQTRSALTELQQRDGPTRCDPHRMA
jgi:hypothetical protein